MKFFKFSIPKRRRLEQLVPISLAVLLSACAMPMAPLEKSGLRESAEHGRSRQPAPQDFPLQSSASRPEGTFPDRGAFRSMGRGLTKDQVRSLFGSPHFDEGFFGVREWNYIFHLTRKAGTAPLTCQYMVRFDADMRTTGGYWRESACADEVEFSATKIIVRPLGASVAPLLKPQSIRFDSDQLFGEAGSRQIELLPQGVRQLELLAAEILGNFGKSAEVSVTALVRGPNRNEDQRAQGELRAVRELLVRTGIDATRVRVALTRSDRSSTACTVRGVSAGASASRNCTLPERTLEIVVSGGHGS